MANYFDTGIQLTAGFSLSGQAPLDGRSIVENLSDLDAHIANNRVYEGMEVYALENKKKYIYNGTTWEEFVGGEGGASTASEVSYSNEALSSVSDVKMALDTIVGAINEISDTQLDTVDFSADYKNIILNRKSGLNPYTIPIASIINNTSLTELKDIDSTDIGNGKTIVYNSFTQKHKYVNTTLTDELVKMDSATDAHYLADLIDKSTIVNEDGILKVKMLDGQDVTIAEINHLKGLTMNVMDLVNSFANGGVKVLNTPVATYADLTTLDRSAFIEGISYIVYVLADETHTGAKTTYLCDKTSSTYFGNADSQRNFTTNPIDLANEITGKLDNSHIDVDSLWSLLTIDDTYKTLTTTDNVFGTHGAKAMYDELTTEMGGKANATDLTTHTDDTDIHITSDERTKWNKVDEKVDKTSITTTINSTSTDTQVPSAKAVFNSISSISGVSNLTSLVDIPNLNDFKGSSFMIGRGTANSTANVPDGIDEAFVVEFIPYDTGDRYGVQRLTLVQSSDNNYSTFERSLSNNVWRSWKKLCTTSIADVPKTLIVSEDTNITLNSSCFYKVINGICYVTLWGFHVKATGQHAVTTSIPKPEMTIQGICTYGRSGDVGACTFVFNDGSTVSLYIEAHTINEPLYGSFSYPVAK